MQDHETPPTIRAATQFFPGKLLQWIGPVVALTVIAVLIGVIVASTGVLAFPASAPDPRGFEQIVHASFQRSVDQHSDDIHAPRDLDALWRVQLGAAHFARSCAACHGEPGRGQNPIVLSMRPRPQYLPAVVHKFTASQLFWIVKHGVKFAGMPAWPTQKRDDEIWSVVAFLRHMKGQNNQQFVDLAYGPKVAAKVPAMLNRSAFTENNANEPPLEDYSYTWPAAALRESAGGGCAGCHGETGAGRPGGEAPNLTLQTPEYLEDALLSFAKGSRPSVVMQNVATSMTHEDIAGAARYFGGKNQASPGQGGNTGTADPLGQAIALRGIPNRHIAACVSCHGVKGASKVGFPVIAGQNAHYLTQQMLLFRTGNRGRTEGYNPMNAEAHKLTDKEIASISSYYSSLAPGESPVR